MKTLISALPHVFVPLTAIIGVIGVLGFLGNVMAFYVFHFRSPSSGFNRLLAMLALYDLITCTVHMPLDVATFFPVGDQVRPILCKVTCFLLAFTSTGSALVLLSIAMVRFHGIHKPLAGQFTPKSAITAISISVLAAAGIGLPITFLFGAGDLELDSDSDSDSDSELGWYSNSNSTTAAAASICAVEPRFAETIGPLSYYITLACLYFITLCLHTFLYSKSVIAVWNRRRMFVSSSASSGNMSKNAMKMTPRTPRKTIPVTANADSITSCAQNSVAITSDTRDNPITQNDDDGSERHNNNHNSISVIAHTSTATANTPSWLLNATRYNTRRDAAATPTNGENPGRNSPKSPVKRWNKQPPSYKSSIADSPSSYSKASTLPVRGGVAGNNVNQTSYRVLAVVIAISVAYFLSYAPHFGVMFYLFLNDSEVFTESAQSLVFELLMRSFFLNNVLDPIIYGLLSADFRREAKRSIGQLCSGVSWCRR